MPPPARPGAVGPGQPQPMGDPESSRIALKINLFLDILFIPGSRRLRCRPARTASDLVFVLGSKGTQKRSRMLINVTFSLIFAILWGPDGSGPGRPPGLINYSRRRRNHFFPPGKKGSFIISVVITHHLLVCGEPTALQMN